MRDFVLLMILFFFFGCRSSTDKQAIKHVDHFDSANFFVGTIKTEGILYGPLMEKKFTINYHFTDTMFKYEYIENHNESGLIINYNLRNATLYAREYSHKRQFSTSITDFENKIDSLDYFKDCINRLYSKIKIPNYIETKTDYGKFQNNKFDLIRYKDNHSELEIYDLKISIPDYVTTITFMSIPKEVQFFPLINQYKRELGLLEKVLLNLHKIVINSIEITDLDLNENFKVPDDYKLVDIIGYSKSDEYKRDNNTGSKSIFEIFDD